MTTNLEEKKQILVKNDFYLNELVINLKNQSHEARLESLETLLAQVKVVPSRMMVEKDFGGMCLLHRILLTFLNLEENYKNSTEIIKYVLIRSDSDYRDYFYVTKDHKLKQKIILEYLKKFDRKEQSVTFYLRQILNSEEQKFINLMRTSHENIAPNVAIRIETNFQHILEVTFIVGSIETLKLLLEYGHQYHDFNKLRKPMLMTVVEVFWLVKDKNRQKYYNCLEYLLTEERLDLGNVMDVVKDHKIKSMLLKYSLLLL